MHIYVQAPFRSEGCYIINRYVPALYTIYIYILQRIFKLPCRS